MTVKYKAQRTARRTGVLLKECFMSRFLPYSTSRKVRASIPPRNHRQFIMLNMALSKGAWLTRYQIKSIEASKYFLQDSKFTRVDKAIILSSAVLFLLLILPISIIIFLCLLIPPTIFKVKRHRIDRCVAVSTTSFWSEYYLSWSRVKPLLTSTRQYMVSQVVDVGDTILISNLVNKDRELSSSDKNLKGRLKSGSTMLSDSGYVLRECANGEEVEIAVFESMDKLLNTLSGGKWYSVDRFILTRGSMLFLINDHLYEFKTGLNLSNPSNLHAYNKNVAHSIIKILRQEATG